jgi:hypothetical protein
LTKIHILTVHIRTDKWIRPQIDYLHKNVKNFKIWSFCDLIDLEPIKNNFDFCESSKIVGRPETKDHFLKLNKLVDIVVSHKDTSDDDVLIFLDSDSFPVKPLNNFIESKLNDYPLIAIQRVENAGDVIPHPSFTACRVNFWRDHELDWKWESIDSGLGRQDAGGYLYSYLLKKNINWYKIKRTKSLTNHPVFYTYYEDIIYHHGAGSRDRITRLDVLRGGAPNQDTEDKIFQKVLNRKV